MLRFLTHCSLWKETSQISRHSEILLEAESLFLTPYDSWIDYGSQNLSIKSYYSPFDMDFKLFGIENFSNLILMIYLTSLYLGFEPYDSRFNIKFKSNDSWLVAFYSFWLMTQFQTFWLMTWLGLHNMIHYLTWILRCKRLMN